MSVLGDFREKHPEYKDREDGPLAFGLWNKFYKDRVSMGEFADKVNLSDDDFGVMLATAKQLGQEPTSITTAENFQPDTGGKFVGTSRAVAQGVTAGASDEIVAGSVAALEKATGNERPFGEIFQQVQAEESARVKAFRKEDPLLAYGGEITGAVLSPVSKITRVSQLRHLNRVGATGKAALDSAAFAMPYAFLAEDGSVSERLQAGGSVAIPAALLGAGGQKMVQISRGAWNKIFKKSVEAPTIENLRRAKNKAYGVVGDSGERFTANEVNGMLRQVALGIKGTETYVKGVDKQVDAVVDILSRQINRPMSLAQLDRIRQNIWERRSSLIGKEGKGNQEALLKGAIDAIDDLIATNPSTSHAMNLARLANARYKKAELLEDSFRKAELSAQATGGSLLSRERSAVKAILANPKRSKWFTKEEVAAMEKFVAGDLPTNVMRVIGSMAPGGNRMVTAINLGAVAVSPPMLAASAATLASKHLAEMATKKQKATLEALIRGARITPESQASMIAPLVGAGLGMDNEEQQ